jgi:hypothetical protein
MQVIERILVHLVFRAVGRKGHGWWWWWWWRWCRRPRRVVVRRRHCDVHRAPVATPAQVNVEIQDQRVRGAVHSTCVPRPQRGQLLLLFRSAVGKRARVRQRQTRDHHSRAQLAAAAAAAARDRQDRQGEGQEQIFGLNRQCPLARDREPVTSLLHRVRAGSQGGEALRPLPAQENVDQADESPLDELQTAEDPVGNDLDQRRALVAVRVVS